MLDGRARRQDATVATQVSMIRPMKISLGSDHAGFLYKEKAKALLLSLGHEVKDCGTDSEKPVPYPQYIRPAAQAVV